ncbi:hypothetical protein [Aliikangiella sp. IMCC44359]|uniref:hypothetical protein n=1 Tax=Aliikangiella sp. IMCC44359 TaxID=3459125 RepID=UPI00403ACF9D
MDKLQSILLFALLSLPTQLIANNDIQTSYYWDNRDFNTATIQISNNDLGNGFSVWGFTDFHSNQDNSDDRYDLSRTFSEYRLSNNQIAKWTGVDHLGLQLEYNDSTPGNNNHQVRFGITYKQILGQSAWLQLRAFPLQSHNDGQLSLIYFYKISDGFNISGFADYNFNKNGKNQWVYEPQLNYQLSDNVWLLLEYRYNGFENSNPNLDGKGTALGIRYHFN